MRVIPIALVFLVAGSAAAQQTPTAPDSTAPRRAAVERWKTAIDLGFASSSGNSDLISLTTGFKVRHLQTRHFKLEWSASFRYGESGGVVVARNLQSQLDFDAGPDARVAPFLFLAAERDPFRRLDLRARSGSGARYRLYRTEKGEASLRLAAQYSREHFTAAAAREPNSDGGWSAGFRAQQQIGDALRIENTTSIDPVFEDASDYTLDVKSKLSTRVTEHVAIALTHTYAFDSTPVEGVGRTDQRLQAGLTIEF